MVYAIIFLYREQGETTEEETPIPHKHVKQKQDAFQPSNGHSNTEFIGSKSKQPKTVQVNNKFSGDLYMIICNIKRILSLKKIKDTIWRQTEHLERKQTKRFCTIRSIMIQIQHNIDFQKHPATSLHPHI